MGKRGRRAMILLTALGGAGLVALAVGILFGAAWSLLAIGVFGIAVAADMIIDENRA